MSPCCIADLVGAAGGARAAAVVVLGRDAEV